MPSDQSDPDSRLRAFIAIETPPEVAQALASLVGPSLPGVKVAPGGRPHLTLRFLGDVSQAALELVKAECRKVASPPFKLTVQGLGLFGHGASKAVLWAGLAPCPELAALKEAVDSALMASLGLAPDKRFKPHLTLARLRSGAASAAQLARRLGDLKIAEFTAQGFTLFKSELTPAKAVHSPLASWPFKGPPEA